TVLGGGIGFNSIGRGDVIRITGSTIANNAVEGPGQVLGGGIGSYTAIGPDPYELILENSTISGNSVFSDDDPEYALGGGMYLMGAALTLTSTTITGNNSTYITAVWLNE